VELQGLVKDLKHTSSIVLVVAVTCVLVRTQHTPNIVHTQNYVDLHLLFGLLLVVSDYKYLIVVLYIQPYIREGEI